MITKLIITNNAITDKFNRIRKTNIGNYKFNSVLSYDSSSFCLLHIFVRE